MIRLLVVETSKSKPIIGILGGICSGKSSVAAEFVKLGCWLIDADVIGHELLRRIDVLKKVVASFGEGILDSAGQIDRGELAKIAFSDKDEISQLNSIIHPLVLEQVEQLIKQYNGQAEVKAIVVDMPLLVEVGWDKRCDKLIFVECARRLRLERAQKTGIFDENQFEIRENFQISLDNKASISDNIIDNNSDFSALVGQVAEIFSYIVNNG